MHIEFDFQQVTFTLLGSILITIASILIPVYGYRRKHWKGMALGCLLQPVVCGIFIIILIACFVGCSFFQNYKEHKAAMVTIRTTETGANGMDTLTWYLKPDDECFTEYTRHQKAKDDSASIGVDRTSDRFDIIRLDSLSHAVAVEDRIIVRFDLKAQKVTATDYDAPAEIIAVDWEKVNTFFQKSQKEMNK